MLKAINLTKSYNGIMIDGQLIRVLNATNVTHTEHEEIYQNIQHKLNRDRNSGARQFCKGCVSGQGIEVESPKCEGSCVDGLGTESPVAFPPVGGWPCPKKYKTVIHPRNRANTPLIKFFLYKTMHTKVLLSFLLFFNIAFTFAQSGKGTLQGRVTTADGKPVAFASVFLKEIRHGDATDENGNYTLQNIPSGSYTLVVKFIGGIADEQTVIITPTQTTTVNVMLRETATQLQEVTVSGQGSYKSDQLSTVSRINTPLIETPQNIIVLNQQVFRDQQAFTPADIARNVSGVNTVFPFPTIYTDFNIRGTRATQSKFRNGISTATRSFGMLMEDLSYVETIEFIKGPAGFMISQGEPGGIYNVVTKKPTDYDLRAANFTMGSFGLFRGHLDVGGRLSDTSKFSYRFNAMLHRSNTHIDYQTNNRVSLAPVVKYDFNKNTSLTIEYNVDLASVRNTDPSIPTVNGQFILPRNFSASDPNIEDPVAIQHQYGFAQMQHNVNENWKLTAQIGVSDASWRGFDLTIRDSVRANNSVFRRAEYLDYQFRNASGQIFVNGKLRTGSVEHNVLVGVDAGTQYFRRVLPNVSPRFTRVFPISNVFAPNYNTGNLQFRLDTLFNTPLTYGTPSQVRYEALYVQNTIKLIPQLILTVAARYTSAQTGTSQQQRDEVITPRLGVTFMPTQVPDLSLYVLYDQSFIPQAGITAAGEQLRPLQGRNYEAGIKRDWFAGRLTTNVALFQILKVNRAIPDPSLAGSFVQTGEITANGFELDVIGSPATGWNLIANYAYTDAKVTQDNRQEIIGTREQAPVHNANVWITYRLPAGVLKGLGAGVGGSYMADRYVLTQVRPGTNVTPATQGKIPNFQQLNAALYYSYQNWNVAINVDNLTDAYNVYGSKGTSGGPYETFFYMPTPGTNWRMTVGVRF
jgi:iron complex outermembrane recepter protein